MAATVTDVDVGSDVGVSVGADAGTIAGVGDGDGGATANATERACCRSGPYRLWRWLVGGQIKDGTEPLGGDAQDERFAVVAEVTCSDTGEPAEVVALPPRDDA
jgi:hypothetical protein